MLKNHSIYKQTDTSGLRDFGCEFNTSQSYSTQGTANIVKFLDTIRDSKGKEISVSEARTLLRT